MYKQLFLLMLSCCFASQSLLANQCPEITITSFDPLTISVVNPPDVPKETLNLRDAPTEIVNLADTSKETVNLPDISKGTVNPPDESKNWKITIHQIDPKFLSEWKTKVLSRLAAEATWTTLQPVDPKLITVWKADLIAKGTDPQLIDKAIQDKTTEYRLLHDLTVYEALVSTTKMDNPNTVVNVPLDYCQYGLISKNAIQYGDPQKKLYYLSPHYLPTRILMKIDSREAGKEYVLIELRPTSTKNISLDSILNNDQVWHKKNSRDENWFHLQHDKENADPDYNAAKTWYECSHNDSEIINDNYPKCNWKAPNSN